MGVKGKMWGSGIAGAVCHHLCLTGRTQFSIIFFKVCCIWPSFSVLLVQLSKKLSS